MQTDSREWNSLEKVVETRSCTHAGLAGPVAQGQAVSVACA